jgi:short-subunit dehydrogenase
MLEIADKVAVVTGASMGIGEAIAKVFADQGANVVLLSRDSSRAEAARHRVGHTDRTLALACDVRNREEIDRVMGLTLHHFDRVDIWVNNAGFGMRDSVGTMDMAVCRDLMETNLFAAIEGMRAVLPVMLEQGSGTIINVSSVAGHIPLPYSAAYSASKFALNAIGKAARIELHGTGVHVMTVCPGYVQTNFAENVVQGKDNRTTKPASVRGISAERVARAVLVGYQKQKREVIVPWTMHPAVKLYQLFPRLVEKFMIGARRQLD